MTHLGKTTSMTIEEREGTWRIEYKMCVYLPEDAAALGARVASRQGAVGGGHLFRASALARDL